jgi:pimeloyl-ACP methyl ester carboxylesterase
MYKERMKKSLLLFAGLVLPLISGFAQGFPGTWNGMLNAGGAKLRLVIYIEEENGIYAASLDSPDQGAKGIPFSRVEVDRDTIRLEISDIRMQYMGALAGDSIIGTFTQNGFSVPLNLKRGGVEAAQRRPQDPQPPFPYDSKAVSFENKEAGIVLAGTLTVPRSGEKFPAVVLLSGSGPQNRDEEILPVNHRPFLVLSDYLTRRGIAVLRYDDRGVGESTGNYGTATLNDFASDATAAFRFLQSRPEVHPNKIGLVGHSEGGTLAFLLAGVHPEVACVASMAGMAVQGDTLLRAQRYLLARAGGASDEMIAWNEQLVERLSVLIDSHSAEYVKTHMDSLITRFQTEEKELLERATAASDVPLSDEALQKLIRPALQQLSSPELRSLLQCDPSAALQSIRCPVFALNGEKDLQVPADMNLSRIQNLVSSTLKIKQYPGLNHLFQHAERGAIDEYSAIEETISPEVLNDVADWILETTGSL